MLGGNASAFDLDQFREYALNFGVLHIVLLGLALVEVVARVRRRCLSPWVLYLPASLVLALVTIGKTGAGESYFLGAIAATSVLAAVRVAHLLERDRLSVEIGLAVALFCQALLLAHGPVSEVIGWLPDRGPKRDVASVTDREDMPSSRENPGEAPGNAGSSWPGLSSGGDARRTPVRPRTCRKIRHGC